MRDAGAEDLDAAQCYLEDLEGQVSEAISRQDWFARWGRHYLPSLQRAHELQQCNNFKDQRRSRGRTGSRAGAGTTSPRSSARTSCSSATTSRTRGDLAAGLVRALGPALPPLAPARARAAAVQQL